MKKKKTAKKKTKLKAKTKAKAKTKKPAKRTAAKARKAPKSKKSGGKARASKRTQKPAMSVIPPPNSTLLGRVEDFYAHVGVIAFTLLSGLRVGDRIQVLGHTTNIEQSVDSMQIEHQAVNEARAKDGIGIKVKDRARHGDYVFLLKA